MVATCRSLCLMENSPSREQQGSKEAVAVCGLGGLWVRGTEPGQALLLPRRRGTEAWNGQDRGGKPWLPKS